MLPRSIKYNDSLYIIAKRVKAFSRFFDFKTFWAVQKILPFTQIEPKYLYQLVDNLKPLNIPGDIVQCGVWKGGSAALMGRTSPKRDLYLYDSFEGFPQPTKEDIRPEWGTIFRKGVNKVSINDVKEALERLSVNAQRVHIKKGFFSRSIFRNSPQEIAFLHIDVDLYEAHLICLESLFDKVVLGGIITFDDFGYLPGATKAIKKFFKKRKIKIFLPRQSAPICYRKHRDNLEIIKTR